MCKKCQNVIVNPAAIGQQHEHIVIPYGLLLTFTVLFNINKELHYNKI